jgi:hypothetical protein
MIRHIYIQVASLSVDGGVLQHARGLNLASTHYCLSIGSDALHSHAVSKMVCKSFQASYIASRSAERIKMWSLVN